MASDSALEAQVQALTDTLLATLGDALPGGWDESWTGEADAVRRLAATLTAGIQDAAR